METVAVGFQAASELRSLSVEEILENYNQEQIRNVVEESIKNAMAESKPLRDNVSQIVVEVARLASLLKSESALVKFAYEDARIVPILQHLGYCVEVVDKNSLFISWGKHPRFE